MQKHLITHVTPKVAWATDRGLIPEYHPVGEEIPEGDRHIEIGLLGRPYRHNAIKDIGQTHAAADRARQVCDSQERATYWKLDATVKTKREVASASAQASQ